MTAILRLLDRRFPRLPWADLDGWRQLAQAGDTVSQYRLGRTLLDGRPHTDPVEARTWLWAASRQGFWPAHYLLGRLAAQRLLPNARLGASLWWTAKALAVALRSPLLRAAPLADRLRPHARSAARVRPGERTKLRYMGAWNSTGVCALEFGQTTDKRLAVLLQSLPEVNSGTSVANMIEHVAFRALVELILDGREPGPSDVVWYEVWPQTDCSRGHTHVVSLTWDAHAECYEHPVWRAIEPEDVPFDISHAVQTTRAGRDDKREAA